MARTYLTILAMAGSTRLLAIALRLVSIGLIAAGIAALKPVF